ncbi:SNF2-related protein [Arsenicicoccus dermatophilus]|uniref:DEAD/DEAH box helicase n=1 Tax=Arsenicicoccus dermatophilus TaxID=1076331 RepID=UPI0039170C9E
MARLVQLARVDELSAAQLRGLCDSGAVTRGLGYTARDMVTELVVSGDGRRVDGLVRGSGRQRYTTWAELRDEPRRPGHSRWSSSCSCPMQVDCKHVVALVLTATQLRSDERAEAEDLADRGPWRPGPSTVTSWRSVVASLAGDDGTPAALQLHLTPPPRRAPTLGPGVTLTPLVQGARGWIKTGISWGGIDPGSYYGTVRAEVDPLHLQTLEEMARAVRARRAVHASGAIDRVSLADMGPPAVPLLRAARRAGVALIDAQGRAVHVPDEPASFEIALETAEDGAVTLRPVLAIPDGIPLTQTLPVGVPAIALVHERPDGLSVVELDPPLTQDHERLLAEGPIEVPAQEWPSFVLEQLPALRRRVRVRVAQDLETTASPRPRLLVQVTPRPGHLTEVELRWRYAVGGRGLDLGPVVPVPGVRETGGRARDHAAERVVLDEVAPLLEPVLAPVARPGAPWTSAATLVLGPAASIALSAVLPDLREHPDVVVEEVLPLPTYVRATGEAVVTLGVDEAAPGSADATAPRTPDDADDDGAGRAGAGGAPDSPAGERGAPVHARSTDWFDLDISVSVDGEDVPLADLILALTTGQELLILPSGRWLPLAEDERLAALATVLAEARSLQDGDSGSWQVTAFHAGLWDELVELGVVHHQSERWRRTVDALRGLQPGDRPVPEGLQATLRPYQHEGFQWLSLLWEARLGGILADDMGLGKTVQTLAAVLRAKETGDLADPLLIVAPTSVVGAWAREAERWTPDLRVVTLDRTLRKAGTTLDRAVGDADVVVTSYALVRLDEEAYLARRWGGLVLDEAQFVKNHQAKTYQVVRRLDAGMKLAVTGTPLENSLMDLWSLLSVVAPGLYAQPREFRDSYVKPIEAGEGAELLATLRRRIRPLMMRRTKEQVADDLPPKIEQLVAVPMHPRHRAVYDRHLQRERQRLLGLIEDDFGRNRVAILRALTALRQLSLHPGLVDAEHLGTGDDAKTDLLVEHLRELAAEGHRALVFSQFTGYLRLVRERLDREGIDHSYLDGRTRKRGERIAEFREGTQTAFLISLKAGGFGLTLTEADYVYVLDPWWNPAAEAQAIDRTHRIGQDRTVNVYRFVSEDTIEDKVVALQQRKRELFARVVDEGDALSGAITAEDIRGLLG